MKLRHGEYTTMYIKLCVIDGCIIQIVWIHCFAGYFAEDIG